MDVRIHSKAIGQKIQVSKGLSYTENPIGRKVVRSGIHVVNGAVSFGALNSIQAGINYRKEYRKLDCITDIKDLFEKELDDAMCYQKTAQKIKDYFGESFRVRISVDKEIQSSTEDSSNGYMRPIQKSLKFRGDQVGFIEVTSIDEQRLIGKETLILEFKDVIEEAYDKRIVKLREHERTDAHRAKKTGIVTLKNNVIYTASARFLKMFDAKLTGAKVDNVAFTDIFVKIFGNKNINQIMSALYPEDIEKSDPIFICEYVSTNGDKKYIKVGIYQSDMDNSKKHIYFDDVTEDVLKDREFKRITNELIKTNERLKKFISSISHDTKNVFTQILSAIHLITNRVNNNKFVTSLLEILKVKVDNTIKRLEKGISLAKGESAHIQDLNVSEIFEKVIQEYGDQKIKFEYSREQLINCRADEDLLSTILSNLFDNSIKHKDKERDLKIQITSKYTENGKFVEYEISDNGEGITKEDKDRIFGKAQRTAKSENREGHGLGLYNVFNAVEECKGEIRLVRFGEEEEGVTFSIILPVVQSKEDKDKLEEDYKVIMSEPKGIDNEKEEVEQFKNIKILFFNDENINRIVFTNQLKIKGYSNFYVIEDLSEVNQKGQITDLETGKKIDLSDINVAFIDLNVKYKGVDNLDGIKFAQYLKEKYPHICLIAWGVENPPEDAKNIFDIAAKSLANNAAEVLETYKEEIIKINDKLR